MTFKINLGFIAKLIKSMTWATNFTMFIFFLFFYLIILKKIVTCKIKNQLNIEIFV